MRLQSNVTGKGTTGKCNPINPGTSNVSISLIVTARGNDISITSTDTACGTTFSRTYKIRAEDDETFDLPDDLHISTLEMLDGISRRFMRFARHGFDREP